MAPPDLEFEYEQETIYEEVENLFRNKPPEGYDITPVKSKEYSQLELLNQKRGSDNNVLKSHHFEISKDGSASLGVSEKEVIARSEQVPLKVDKDSGKQSSLKEDVSKSEKLSSKVVPTPTAKKPPVKKQSVSINFNK